MISKVGCVIHSHYTAYRPEYIHLSVRIERTREGRRRTSFVLAARTVLFVILRRCVQYATCCGQRGGGGLADGFADIRVTSLPFKIMKILRRADTQRTCVRRWWWWRQLRCCTTLASHSSPSLSPSRVADTTDKRLTINAVDP